MSVTSHKIVLFDGVCNFCNASVNFIMARDKHDRFRYAALQSDAGIRLQKRFNIDPNDLSSFILIEGDEYYRKTTAALRVGKYLGLPWSLSYVFNYHPPFHTEYCV